MSLKRERLETDDFKIKKTIWLRRKNTFYIHHKKNLSKGGLIPLIIRYEEKTFYRETYSSFHNSICFTFTVYMCTLEWSGIMKQAVLYGTSINHYF